MHPLTALRDAAAGTDVYDRPDAVTIGDASMSRAELAESAAPLAMRIAGARAVAVRAEATMSTVIAVVAGLLAGVPVVPLAADAGDTEIAYMLADSGATLMIRDDGRAASPVPVDVDGVPRTARAPTAGTALVLYTSGTTGRPKGVQLGHDAIAANLDALADAWAWTADDTLVHGLPMFHVHGLVLGVLGPLRHGCRLVHTVRPTPDAYAAARGTLYFGVPTVWSRICAEPGAARALSAARLLVSGSAPLPRPVFDRLAVFAGQKPIERYGMTETLITCSTRTDGDRRAGSVGLPLPGVRTRLAPVEAAALDSADANRPWDAATADGLGELEVHTASLFDGYLGRPDATAAAFTDDGWFRTGDIATIGADGMHRIVGRASVDLIKSGGYRIGAGEVEDALLAHDSVREAAVVGAPHDDLGQEIVAYVVADGVTEDALVAFTAERLSWHKRPRRIVFLDSLPRNALGKVRKQALLP
ncbi:MAG TPA: AMP-binding protein [Micromonosporaceae bacterium]|nr:AMP-binding protein [Micromonosporaceae bacterium]